MQIERLELYHIRQKLVSPFETSFGRQEMRDSLVLAMHGDGLSGWGECVATGSPGYSYETTATAWHILADFLIPALLGTELAEPEELAGRLRFVRGHPLAKAALDQAAWGHHRPARRSFGRSETGPTLSRGPAPASESGREYWDPGID